MSNKESLYKRVADIFIDRECELESPDDCIRFLMKSGFSDDELEVLLFAKTDIKQVREELKEEEKQ